jgi:hypothetical protein
VFADVEGGAGSSGCPPPLSSSTIASRSATIRRPLAVNTSAKHIRIDQAKLDKARKVLAAATETEALDRALTLVVSEAEVDAALREVSRKGRLKKLFP